MQNATALDFTQTDQNERLRTRLKSAQRDGLSFAAIAVATGVSRTAISMYVNKGLDIGVEKVEAITAYLNERDGDEDTLQVTIDSVKAAEPKRYKQKIEVYQTGEYREAIGWCNYVRDKRKMGVMIGFPGTGKTTILKEFSKMARGIIYVDCWPTMRMSSLIQLLAGELGISVKGAQHEKIMQIVSELTHRDDVTLVFDEAENLRSWNITKFEVLRKIWDSTGTPVILCGTPKLEDMLTVGGGRDNLAQLYRRKYEIRLGGISTDEVLGILNDYDITPDAANKLVRVATDVKHGGLGNFVELLDMALEAAEGGTVDEAIIKGAMQYKMMY